MVESLHRCASTNYTGQHKFCVFLFDYSSTQMAGVEGTPGCAEGGQKQNMTPLEDLPLVLKETTAPLNFCGLTPCHFGISAQSFTPAKSSNCRGNRIWFGLSLDYCLVKIGTSSLLLLVVVEVLVCLCLPMIQHLHYSYVCLFFSLLSVH